MIKDRILSAVRDIPDFPKPGIIFKDITPLFKDAQLCKDMVEALVEPFKDSGLDAIVGIESRGFLLGPSMAQLLGIKFIPVRKPGKLPYHVIKQEYALEYASL